jgi:hypothetical protein
VFLQCNQSESHFLSVLLVCISRCKEFSDTRISVGDCQFHFMMYESNIFVT